MRRSFSVALLGAVLPCCAATSGREWLSAPLEDRPPAGDAAIVAEAPTEARPRLRHTVTLGESYAPAPERSNAAPGPPATSVQVTVQTQVPVVVNHYGGYGYGYGYGYSTAAPVRVPATTAGSQKVGADWPAVPDYGPRPMR